MTGKLPYVFAGTREETAGAKGRTFMPFLDGRTASRDAGFLVFVPFSPHSIFDPQSLGPFERGPRVLFKEKPHSPTCLLRDWCSIPFVASIIRQREAPKHCLANASRRMLDRRSQREQRNDGSPSIQFSQPRSRINSEEIRCVSQLRRLRLTVTPRLAPAHHSSRLSRRSGAGHHSKWCVRNSCTHSLQV